VIYSCQLCQGGIPPQHDLKPKIRRRYIMPELKVGDRVILLDEDGFLDNPSDWDEEVAKALAQTEDVLELTEEHWGIINYLRKYYAEFGVAPMVRKLLKDTGKTQAEIYDLFPSGPGKGACKIAGLPKPTGCV